MRNHESDFRRPALPVIAWFTLLKRKLLPISPINFNSSSLPFCLFIVFVRCDNEIFRKIRINFEMGVSARFLAFVDLCSAIWYWYPRRTHYPRFPFARRTWELSAFFREQRRKKFFWVEKIPKLSKKCSDEKNIIYSSLVVYFER